MHERDTEKEKQNGRKGPRVMGMIMYASCRAGSSSCVGMKPFRKSLLFQNSFETLQKSSPWVLQLFSHCFSLSICVFPCLRFISAFWVFYHFLCLPIELCGSQSYLCLNSWRKEGVCDGHRCTLQPLCPALPGPLIRAERRLLVLTVSLPFPVSDCSLSPSDYHCLCFYTLN